jgi:uncharacterized DUF497 family protein
VQWCEGDRGQSRAINPTLASRIYKVYGSLTWFEWDPAKSDRTFVERGIDFAFATLIFDGALIERADLRHDYGEERFVATGLAGGQALTVVYTDRMKSDSIVVRRIISAREASKHECQAYQAAYGQAYEATYLRLVTETDPGPR